MNFESPLWLYALPFLTLLLPLLFYKSNQWARGALLRFISKKIADKLTQSFSQKKKLIKQGLITLSILLIILALARPQWGSEFQERQARGIDILIALDVSKSMLSQDIKPSRLERAKLGIMDFTSKLRGSRIGLILFSGEAFLQCPLTLDFDSFLQSLQSADPSSIYNGGTNIQSAIQVAEKTLENNKNHKTLILISDGEDLSGQAIPAAKAAVKNGLTIYTVGIGTETGDLIPITDQDGKPDFLRDSQGKIVKTALNEKTLTVIADQTDGFYAHFGPAGEGLDQVYELGLSSIPEQELSSRMQQIPIEQFQWPLGIAIYCLLLEPLIRSRKNQSQEKNKNAPKPAAIPQSSPSSLNKSVSKKILSLILFLSFLSFINLPNPAHASPEKDAFEAYNKGQFDSAANLYKKAVQENPDSPVLKYNLGTALYKEDKPDQALDQFNQSLNTDDPDLQQKAFYNAANSQFKLGESTITSNPQETLKTWQSSLKNYQNALEIDPTDSAADQNLQFLKNKIEELKQSIKNQQQQQNQQNSQQQNNSQNNQSQQNQQNNSPQQNQASQNNPTPEKNSSSYQPNPSPEKNPSQNQANPNQEKTPQNPTDPLQSVGDPGTLSPEQARQMLDALKENEKNLPFTHESNSQSTQQPYQDW